MRNASRSILLCSILLCVLVSLGSASRLRADDYCKPTRSQATASAAALGQAATIHETPRPQAKRSITLPGSLLFAPPVANPLEPRMYLAYRRQQYLGHGIPAGGREVIDSGMIAAGASFGLWGHRDPEGTRGIQVDLTGGVFSQFNLGAPSRDLLNSDFLIGVVGSWRNAGWSARVRVTHLSAHLGDEFLLRHPEVTRVNLAYEQVDGLLSYAHQGMRFYAGGGYLFNGIPTAGHGTFQIGWEWQGRCVRSVPSARLWFAPVIALDLQLMGVRAWYPTASAKTGIMLARNDVRTRLLFTYLRGYLPFSQFYSTERVNSFGIELQFEP